MPSLRPAPPLRPLASKPVAAAPPRPLLRTAHSPPGPEQLLRSPDAPLLHSAHSPPGPKPLLRTARSPPAPEQLLRPTSSLFARCPTRTPPTPHAGVRSEYSVWKTLTQKASGIGRDEYMKTIAALDGWWALEIKANPVATKFRYAPLLEEEKTRKVFDACCVTNEHARVSIPTYQSGSSRFNMGDDPGCESHDVEGTPRPKRAKSGKKMPCSYSSSPRMNEKWSNEIVKTDALVRTVDLFGAREKIKGNSREDTIRKEIEDMMDMVIEDCAKPGSDVHFYASHIML
ncbi:uncharacterized protein LOC123453023 [Hordeum vulgare subsp. vulgare]|uniref:Predicted protein n=1 Tax=Hordeum vulgare subsp. vulgare TaxID=112509 RepID=F2CVI0_HORVV|nr:uncharacterized protein LOC123453023 [Hordeum vulgare subsp. vulgare]BAJ86851.1 predicted protein [Hordeum vulgare subsp. vulgare]